MIDKNTDKKYIDVILLDINSKLEKLKNDINITELNTSMTFGSFRLGAMNMADEYSDKVTKSFDNLSGDIEKIIDNNIRLLKLNRMNDEE